MENPSSSPISPVTPPAKVPIQLIVGLGNPGEKYEATRHNAGVWFIQALCKHLHLKLKMNPQWNALFQEATIAKHAIKLMIPNTFMNHSGQPVGNVVRYFQIPMQAVLVAHDDLDIPLGEVRLKKEGGHAGHNGLRDIIHHLHGREFLRLRIGIGRPTQKDEVMDYVLENPSSHERKLIEQGIESVMTTIPLLLKGDIEGAMQILHTNNNSEE